MNKYQNETGHVAPSTRVTLRTEAPAPTTVQPSSLSPIDQSLNRLTNAIQSLTLSYSTLQGKVGPVLTRGALIEAPIEAEAASGAIVTGPSPLQARIDDATYAVNGLENNVVLLTEALAL